MKKYYFISGLPRSGNTLLASLLNQNPKIHATGHAWTTDLMFSLKSYLFHDTERCQNYPNHFAIQNIYKKMFDTFYYNVDKPYILERGDWMTPFNYQMIKQFCPNEVKIVILVRDILDIIKSYLKLCDQYPDFFINDNYNRLDKTTVFKSEIEEKADLIMDKNEYIYLMLYSINNLIKLGEKDKFLIVEYKDLVSNTEQTLERIYGYLNIKSFKHSFKNFKKLEGYNDQRLGAPMHEIRTDDVSFSKDIELPQEIINKYSGLEIWRK